MKQQFHAITIAAKNLPLLKRFYSGIFQWELLTENEKIVMLKLNGVVLSLCEEALFEQYSASSARREDKGFYLTINFDMQKEVNELFDTWKNTEVQIIKMPEKTFWGGYSGFIADPENSRWEIAYNPIEGTKA